MTLYPLETVVKQSERADIQVVWPDLEKFRPYGKHSKAFRHFSKGFKYFANFYPEQKVSTIGQIFIWL